MYGQLLRVQECAVGLDYSDFWEKQFATTPYSSVLNLTCYGTACHWASGTTGSNRFDLIYVNSVPSLCMYWDCRATRESVAFVEPPGRRTLLVADRLLESEHMRTSLSTFLRAHIYSPHHETNVHLRVHFWEARDREKLGEMLCSVPSLCPLEVSAGKVAIRETVVAGRVVAKELAPEDPLVFAFVPPSVSLSFREGFGSQIATPTVIGPGKNELLITPPDGFNNRFAGETAIDFETDLWERYPKAHAIASRISKSGWFSRYGFTTYTRPRAQPAYFTLYAPDEHETLRLYFESHRHGSRPSDKAKYATAVIELAGGLAGIRKLRSLGAYRLLETLAVKSSKKVAQRLVGELKLAASAVDEVTAVLQDIDVEVMADLKRVPKSYKKLRDGPLVEHKTELLTLLSELSDLQIVKRGLHLRCPHCGTHSWYPLMTIREMLSCPGCSHEFPLPVEYPAGNEIEWEYTLNSLVNRAMDQDLIPVLLTLSRLSEDRDLYCVTPGLELLEEDKVIGEFDFVFVSKNETYAGECKTGRRLMEKDLVTARLAAANGVTHFYYATPQRFTEETLGAIECLREELLQGKVKTEVTVLDGEDLLGAVVE